MRWERKTGRKWCEQAHLGRGRLGFVGCMELLLSCEDEKTPLMAGQCPAARGARPRTCWQAWLAACAGVPRRLTKAEIHRLSPSATEWNCYAADDPQRQLVASEDAIAHDARLPRGMRTKTRSDQEWPRKGGARSLHWRVCARLAHAWPAMQEWCGVEKKRATSNVRGDEKVASQATRRRTSISACTCGCRWGWRWTRFGV